MEHVERASALLRSYGVEHRIVGGGKVIRIETPNRGKGEMNAVFTPGLENKGVKFLTRNELLRRVNAEVRKTRKKAQIKPILETTSSILFPDSKRTLKTRALVERNAANIKAKQLLLDTSKKLEDDDIKVQAASEVDYPALYEAVKKRQTPRWDVSREVRAKFTEESASRPSPKAKKLIAGFDISFTPAGMGKRRTRRLVERLLGNARKTEQEK